MFNIFLSDYFTRLRAWHSLKNELQEKSTEEICIAVDKFWQRTPMINHLLHPDDIEDWPNPWELLYYNDYCLFSRGLGMVYTLLLLGIQNIDFIEALDDNNEQAILVLVDDAKYTLNYWPDSVLNTTLSSFKIIKKLNVEILRKKIGE